MKHFMFFLKKSVPWENFSRPKLGFTGGRVGERACEWYVFINIVQFLGSWQSLGGWKLLHEPSLHHLGGPHWPVLSLVLMQLWILFSTEELNQQQCKLVSVSSALCCVWRFVVEALRIQSLFNLILSSRDVSSKRPQTEQYRGGNRKGGT